MLSLLLVLLPVTAFAGLDLPVAGTITSGVGWRLDPFGSGKMVFHRGIDIAVPVGTPVHATHKGKVVFAGEKPGYGAAVIIEHPNGDRTLYGHNSTVSVRTGQEVEAGTVIAFSGNSGRSTGPHVHYERIPGGRPIQPEVAVAKAEGEAPPLPSALGLREREVLEKKMDEAVQSILQRIKTSNGGLGG
ncbi:M23 family metallopeptidase [Geomonas sp. Red32]|nr:M23 family metallopeptidase [Geomonas sp. Red32]